MKKGKLIVFEGPEGSGKSTMHSRIREYIPHGDVGTFFMHFPPRSVPYNHIRHLLCSDIEVKPITEMMLYASMRAEFNTEIKSRLDQGENVILDRYVLSSESIQVGGRGLSKKDFLKISDVVGDIKPDLTIIYDINPKKGIERSLKALHDESIKIGKKVDESYFEGLPIEFHEKCREVLIDHSIQNPNTSAIIDASAPIDDVFDTTIRIINRILGGNL